MLSFIIMVTVWVLFLVTVAVASFFTSDTYDEDEI